MTVTAKKLAANRANARKSTGPRTAAGKRRSSRNAVTHGLFCNDTVLPGEDARLFEQFRHAVLLKLSPQDVVELMIVDRVVIAQWKLRRLNAVEATAHIGNAQARIERARDELNERRRERTFDGSDDDQREATANDLQEKLIDATAQDLNVIESIAISVMNEDGLMERFSRYEQRLELSIHRNLRQLEKLRKQTQSDQPTRRCPFLPADAYDDAHEQIAARERNRQSEPKEMEDDAETDTDHQEPITQNEPEQTRSAHDAVAKTAEPIAE